MHGGLDVRGKRHEIAEEKLHAPRVPTSVGFFRGNAQRGLRGVDVNGGSSARGQQLAHCGDHGGQHLLRVLLDPSRLRMRQGLLATRLRDRPEVGVVHDRLDGGCPLVDSQQQLHRAARSAARRHHGTAAAFGEPARSSRSGPNAIPIDPTSEHTRSAIPSDALSPVDLIAATLTSRGHAPETPTT